MKVRLGAVGAGEFAVGVLLRDDSVLGSTGARRGSRSARGTGKDTAPTLGSNHVGRLLLVLQNRLLLGHQGALAVRRGHAGLRHDTASGHGTQDRRTRCGSGRNGLRVGLSHRRLGHHGRGSAVPVLRGLRVVHHLRIAAGSSLRGRLRVVTHSVGGRGRVGRAGRARRMRVAVVNRVHSRVGMGLQRGQRVRREVVLLVLRRQLAVLKLVRRDGGCVRWIARTRCAYDIRVVRVVHIPVTRSWLGVAEVAQAR